MSDPMSKHYLQSNRAILKEHEEKLEEKSVLISLSGGHTLVAKLSIFIPDSNLSRAITFFEAEADLLSERPVTAPTIPPEINLLHSIQSSQLDQVLEKHLQAATTPLIFEIYFKEESKRDEIKGSLTPLYVSRVLHEKISPETEELIKKYEAALEQTTGTSWQCYSDIYTNTDPRIPLFDTAWNLLSCHDTIDDLCHALTKEISQTEPLNAQKTEEIIQSSKRALEEDAKYLGLPPDAFLH